MKHLQQVPRLLSKKLGKNTKPVLFAVGFGVIGIALLLTTKASTPAANSEVESGSKSANAVVVTDGTASGGSAVKFANTPTTPPLGGGALKGWELTTSNVGLAPHGLTCAGLPKYTGSLTIPKDAMLSNYRFEGNLDLAAGGITIEKSCIKPTAANGHAVITNDICGADECVVTSAGSVIIKDSEIDASAVPLSSDLGGECAFRGVGTLQRNYMHGMGSGICFFGTGLVHNALAEQNYVTSLRAWDHPTDPGLSTHNEAATVRDFRKNTNNTRRADFINNRFDCSSGNTTGGLFLQPTWVDVVNVWVTGNYLEGEGYNLYLNKAGGNYSNVHATNNRFRSTGWGPAVVDGGAGWDEWTENYRYDATKPDAKGAAVSP